MAASETMASGGNTSWNTPSTSADGASTCVMWRVVSRVRASAVDLVARGLVTQQLHAAYAATVAVATATATRLPGTIPAQVATQHSSGVVRIGHPGGVLTLEVAVELGTSGGARLTRAVIERTARRVMAGEMYVPMHVLSGNRSRETQGRNV